ncbi:signal peptidase I [Dermabacteraceae bacterium P9123]
MGLALFAAFFAVAVLACRAYLFDVYRVSSASMEPTLPVGTLVGVSPGSEGVQRGSLVVFPASALNLPSTHRHLIKRVIAVGGDELISRDGRLILNGKPLREPYLAPGSGAGAIDFHVKVPAGHVWLLGDSRDSSLDSRAALGLPGGGMLEVADITGVAHWRLEPFRFKADQLK